MNLPRLFSTLAAICVVVGITGHEARAAVLAYEGFDYNVAADTALNTLGSSGGGWAGGWSGNSGYLIASGSLSDDGLPTSGDKVTGNNAWQTIARPLDVSGTFSAWQEGSMIGKDGTDIWVSFVSQQTNTASNQQGSWMSLSNGNVNDRASNVTLGTSKQSDGSGWAWNRWLAFERLASPDYNADWAQDGTSNDGTPMLMVAHITFGAGDADTVEVYLGQADPNTWTANFDIDVDNAAFDDILLGTSTGGKVHFWDEIRIGESAFDVVGLVNTVPEPGSMVLWSLGVSLLGFVAWRRRRTRTIVA